VGFFSVAATGLVTVVTEPDNVVIAIDAVAGILTAASLSFVDVGFASYAAFAAKPRASLGKDSAAVTICATGVDVVPAVDLTAAVTTGSPWRQKTLQWLHHFVGCGWTTGKCQWMERK